MIPEAEFIRKEFILREMDFPESVALTRKSLLRWCSLALGLISPKETREKGFLVLDALFHFLFTKKQHPTTLDLHEYIKEKNKTEMSEKLIRYHLNRLIELGVLQRKANKYSINPSPTSEKRDSLKESFNAHVKKKVDTELEQVGEALEKLQKLYAK